MDDEMIATGREIMGAGIYLCVPSTWSGVDTARAMRLFDESYGPRSPVIGAGVLADFADCEFNRFRHREGGHVVEAWQWWPGKAVPDEMRNGESWTVYLPGTWGIREGLDIRMVSAGEFSREYEPVHPARRMLQAVCDDWNEKGACWLVEDSIVMAEGAYYVKDKAMDSSVTYSDEVEEDTAGPTICADCEHLHGPRLHEKYIDIGLLSCCCPESQRMNYQVGRKVMGLCREVNPDGKCAHFRKGT